MNIYKQIVIITILSLWIIIFNKYNKLFKY